MDKRNQNIIYEALMLTPFAVIGQKENISRERVRQIVAKGIGKDLINFIRELRKEMFGSKNTIYGEADFKEYHKEYYQKNKDKLLKQNSQWKKENKDKTRGYCKKYYYKNKEKAKISHQKYYLKNREKLLNYVKNWRIENRDKFREYQRKYQKEHYRKIINKRVAESVGSAIRRLSDN